MAGSQFVLSNNEVRLILALSADNNDNNATIGELAATIQLSPSEIQDLIPDLLDKFFISFDKETQLITLLDEGLKLSSILTRQLNSSAVQSRESQSVVFVPNEINPAAGSDEIDETLDDAIRKLREA